MKKKFENPELTIILFLKEDIITESIGGGTYDTEPGDDSEDPED